MNKEYIQISNNEVIVSDEKGNVVRRNINSESAHDLLLLENKLEEVNKISDRTEELIKYYKNFLSRFSKSKRKTLLFFSTMPLLICGIGSIFSFYDAAIAFVITELTFLIAIEAGFKISKKMTSKALRGCEKKLEATIELKEDYEKRLNKSKTLTNENKTELIDNYKNDMRVFDVVSLNKENKNISTNIYNYLQEFYDQGYNEGSKKLVLKKK